MEPYIEMLVNGGHWTTYEIHECDYSELKHRLLWTTESEDFATEKYYDTSDSTLEKSGCNLQVTQLMSGAALLTLCSKDTLILYQYLDAFEEVENEIKNIDSKIADELRRSFDISADDLHSYCATALKSSVMKIADVWVILSAEIVYGKHQASLSCVSVDPEDGRSCLDAILRHLQIRKKSEKTRIIRFRANKTCRQMEGTPEQNKDLYPCLLALGKGYETGFFDDFFPYLSEECEKTSQWNYETVCGKEAVISYFKQKGEFSQKNAGKVKTRVVELVNHMNPVSKGGDHAGSSFALLYSEGKLCLYLTQYTDHEIVRVIVDLDMDENNKVESICLCMPELFQFRTYRPERKVILDETIESMAVPEWVHEGLKVKHESFGEGTVCSVRGNLFSVAFGERKRAFLADAFEKGFLTKLED